MSHAKEASRRKHRGKGIKAVPVLGAAGLSLSLVGPASASTGGPAAVPVAGNVASNHEIMLGEEQISDVSLGTFYVFDKENPGSLKPDVKTAACGRCGGCRGCGGCRCGGCGGWWGCGGCGCGCCLSWGRCAWC